MGAPGYAWWYLDALSDDGTEGLTLIAFVGSVFSPYYAWAGRADPLDHVAVNVALYRPSGGRWSMTERGKRQQSRSATSFVVGPSRLEWTPAGLEVHLDERGWPLPRAVRGRLTLVPELDGGEPVLLSGEGGHTWWPIAPRARVELALDEPAVRWSGTGYLDSNWGDGRLEDAFRAWTWSRAPLSSGAAVLYDVELTDGSRRAMAFRFGPGGRTTFSPPPPVALPRTAFWLPRVTRSEGPAAVVRTHTDAHFYARSAIRSRLCGEDTVGMHESLSLTRFDTTWAKLMLPFRMPRWPFAVAGG